MESFIDLLHLPDEDDDDEENEGENPENQGRNHPDWQFMNSLGFLDYEVRLSLSTFEVRIAMRVDRGGSCNNADSPST